jgi:hypothetical protein
MTATKKVTATPLVDLDVERVDGVDRPATGKRFALFKAKMYTPDTDVEVIEKREVPSGRRTTAGLFDALVFGEVSKSLPPTDDTLIAEELFERKEPVQVDSDAMDQEDRRMAGVLQSWSGQGSIHQVRPQWARDSFLDPSGEWSQRPMKPYEIIEDPFIGAPKDPGFTRGGLGETVVATPAEFSAPKPAAVRSGDGYVLRSVNGKDMVTKASGFWAGSAAFVPMSPSEIEHAAIQAGDAEVIAAISKAKQDQKVEVRPLSRARRGGSRWI